VLIGIHVSEARLSGTRKGLRSWNTGPGQTFEAWYPHLLLKNMSISTAKSSATVIKNSQIVEGLNLVLADSYALMALTHLAHWNVEGSDFFPLHKIFQEQYENLFEAVDEIAERVRALDAYSIGGLSTLAKTAEMEEFKSPLPQKDYVAGLIIAHEKVVDDALRVRNEAGVGGDLQTQDLMIKRLQWHEKTLWMFKSYLKN
jgi:starvation-inducible DNA-binding protein